MSLPLLSSAATISAVGSEGSPAVPKLPPIANGNTPLVPLLRTWWDEGTAAGNVGDYYENRDGDHSPFPVGEFPQLTRWTNAVPSVDNDTGWGASRTVRPVVVVGNSSTAGSPPNGSGQGRRLLSQPTGVEVLYRQYRANNLYIYPEHLDHDPGVGGSGGWGDLFPANSPYLINSQGSSGSDLAFVRGAFAGLAAFQPLTKQRLNERGLLMPTLQMLFRSTGTHLASPDEYFTGKAHPSAFNPATVDPVRMAQAAHAILPEEIPPLAQLRIVQEPSPSLRIGVHYFDTNIVERLTDSPASISRVWRSLDPTRRIVVSAEDSFDANDRPLTFRWVVLRGDPSRIKIRPLNASRSIVEITVEWAGRQPIETGSGMSSSRQDVGLFVSNGVWWSAPAFLTWYASDQELRSYDRDGRLLDAGYVAGDVIHEIRELTPFLEWLRQDPSHRGVQLVQEAAGTQLINAWLSQDSAIRSAETLEATTLTANTDATNARNAAFTALTQAEEAARAQGTSVDTPAIQLLRTEYNATAATAAAAAAAYSAARIAAAQITTPIRLQVSTFFDQLAQDPEFSVRYSHHLIPRWNAASQSSRNFLNTAKARLVSFGMIPLGSDWRFRSSIGLSEFTAFEKNFLSDLHSKLIGQLVQPGGVTPRFLNHIVDRSLFPPKNFRDVYHYDASGRSLGWRRFRATGIEDFTADGFLVLNRDTKGRPREAAGVTYVLPRQGIVGTSTGNVLETQRNGRTYTYHYLDDSDLRGRALENQ